MSAIKGKKSLLWAITIIITSIFVGGIGGYITNKGIVGGALALFILTLIPFLIEYLRRIDPIKYYGLDFTTLKKINLKVILLWGLVLIISLGLIDFLVFDLANLIRNEKNLLAGSTSVALAKSARFCLAFIVLFSGTFLEEIWFRGIIQFKLSHLRILERANPYFAIIVQSILFGLAHLDPTFLKTDFSIALRIGLFVDPAIAGIVIGYFDFKYQSLWPGWIIHYINNLLWFIFKLLFFY